MFFKMAAVPAFFGLLLVTFVTGQNVDVQPHEAVRRIGDEVNVLCKVSYPIDSCRMRVGGVSYRLIPSNQDGDVVYSGQGLEYGECGAQIRNIKEDWNGNVSCILPPQTGSIEITGSMRLIVARAPDDPQLISSSFASPNFREGEELRVQCVVPNGRPAAKITWLLNDEPLLVGPHQPILTPSANGDLQTISQNVTRFLTADDSNRMLVCKAEHEAMDQPRTASMQIIVNYKPKRLEQDPITIFGLKLGEEGKLNVTVRANPAPNVEWSVGDQRLTPGQSDNQAKISVLHPNALGNGYFNITLVISSISKEDVDRTYYLRVWNDEGSEDFAVRLSTMDEPAGVELGTGAIVGIVVAVLVLLIAVFLVVFAKATDRWCFGGGRRRDNTKSSGESDTESAVGGRAERSRLAELGARVRAVLPRSKDKVQATETQATTDTEEKPLSDDKKNVVYAELALGDAAREKPPPHSTEYAQIVYTTPGSEPTVNVEGKET